MGIPMYLEGDCWGAHLLCIVHNFLSKVLQKLITAHGQQGLQVPLEDDVVSPHLGEFVGEVYVALPPHLRDLNVTLQGML